MTLIHRAALPLLALSLLSLSGNAAVTSSGSFEPATDLRVALTVAPDTVRTSAEPGTPLVLPLPATLNGRSIEHYSLLRGPSLSGAAGRSFTWIPEGATPGTHEALLQAHAPDMPPDTLVVRIDFQP